MRSVYLSSRNPYLQPVLHEQNSRQDQAGPIGKDLTQPSLLTDDIAKEIFAGLDLILTHYGNGRRTAPLIPDHKPDPLILTKKFTRQDFFMLANHRSYDIVKKIFIGLGLVLANIATLGLLNLDLLRNDSCLYRKYRNVFDDEAQHHAPTRRFYYVEHLLKEKGAAYAASFLHELKNRQPQVAKTIANRLLGYAISDCSRGILLSRWPSCQNNQKLIGFVDSLLGIYKEITPYDAHHLISTVNSFFNSTFQNHDQETIITLITLILKKVYSRDKKLIPHTLHKTFESFWHNFLQEHVRHLLREKGVAPTINFLENSAKSHLQITATGIQILLKKLTSEKFEGIAFNQNNQEFIRVVDSLLHICEKVPLETLKARLLITAHAAYKCTVSDEPHMSLSKEQCRLLALLILENMCSYDIEKFNLEYLKHAAGNDFPLLNLDWNTINTALQDLKKDYLFHLFYTLRLLEKEDSASYRLPNELIKLIVEREDLSS